MARTVDDAVVPPVLQFMQVGVQSQDWRAREAAILAFGSVSAAARAVILAPSLLALVLARLADGPGWIRTQALSKCEISENINPTRAPSQGYGGSMRRALSTTGLVGVFLLLAFAQAGPPGECPLLLGVV